MVKTANERHTLSVGATRVIRVNFTPQLDDGASLTGTPTAVEQTTADLTIANVAVTSSSYTEDGTSDTVASGKAVLFTVAGGSAGTTYTVLVTASTDSSPAETIPLNVLIDWE